MREETLTPLLRKLVAARDFDPGLAEDASSSILFKVREAEERLEAERLQTALRPLVTGNDPDFDRRSESVLYDLVDGLAVLPAGGIGRSKRPISNLTRRIRRTASSIRARLIAPGSPSPGATFSPPASRR